MEKKTGAGKIFLAVILVICIISGPVMSGVTYVSLKPLLVLTEEEDETATTENDVTIAEQYVIRSTTQISDAYISGNTAELSDKDKETLDMASAVLDEIIEDDMTDFEKEKAVYDWMCKNLGHDAGLLTVIPSTSADCDNPYGVLKYHNAVCVGYATTFRLFMQMLGIECMVVHNTECYHSWDLVKLDGHWYHTDVYSDVNNSMYRNFNLTDLMMSQGQTWDTGFFPAADNMTYNMAFRNMKKAKNIYSIPQVVRKAAEQKDASFCVRFSEKITEEKAALAAALLERLQNRMSEIGSEQLECYVDSYRWVPDSDNEGSFVLWISLYHYGETSAELTEEEQQKIDQAIEEAFADLMGGSTYE